MESLITIILGLALLFFQVYSEKKKKEAAAKSKRKIINDEPFLFTDEPKPEQIPVKERPESILDTPKKSYFKPVDIIESAQNDSFADEIKDIEPTEEEAFSVDPRQMVIFSEIMKPKYIEQ